MLRYRSPDRGTYPEDLGIPISSWDRLRVQREGMRRATVDALWWRISEPKRERIVQARSANFYSMIWLCVARLRDKGVNALHRESMFKIEFTFPVMTSRRWNGKELGRNSPNFHTIVTSDRIRTVLAKLACSENAVIFRPPVVGFL